MLRVRERSFLLKMPMKNFKGSGENCSQMKDGLCVSHACVGTELSAEYIGLFHGQQSREGKC